MPSCRVAFPVVVIALLMPLVLPAQPGPVLKRYVSARLAETDQIPAVRKAELDALAKTLGQHRDSTGAINVLFVCTHNSRRSQMAQVWASVAAWHYGLEVNAYSGGTEVTAFNPRAVAALQRAGARLMPAKPNGNPVFHLQLPDQPTRPLFSKTFDDPANPAAGFVAVMVCSDADRQCPIVPGAAARVSLPYLDPKHADNSATEADAYDATSREIARQLLYVFRQLP